MQIKTTVRFFLMQIWMADLKKLGNRNVGSEDQEKGNFAVLKGLLIGATTVVTELKLEPILCDPVFEMWLFRE